MAEIKNLKDLVIPITDYPHMPYWATLEEAIVLLNFSYETGHYTILVFDESYRLLGVLHQREILRGIQPKLVELSPKGVPNEWEELMSTANPKQLKRPIKDFMTPFNIIVDVEDHILKVAHLMLKHNTGLLPVKKSEKVIGAVGMHNIFHEITAFILKSKVTAQGPCPQDTKALRL
ncbi:MAG: CBS domain-containing protein [Pseudomonadota bacterium]